MLALQVKCERTLPDVMMTYIDHILTLTPLASAPGGPLYLRCQGATQSGRMAVTLSGNW